MAGSYINFEKHLNTLFLGIISAATIGAFGFLWNVNKTLAVMQERDEKRSMQIQQVQTNMNDLRLDVKDSKYSLQDVRERVIRLEVNKK